MKELLLNGGFKETDYDNEWVKDTWTIRLFLDEIEVFNEPRVNTPGVYYKCESTIENLNTILNEIDDRIK